MTENIIYLDNAATTFPKPRSVLDATFDCAEHYCGNAGRGSHALALRSAETIYSAREAVASHFSAKTTKNMRKQSLFLCEGGKRHLLAQHHAGTQPRRKGRNVAWRPHAYQRHGA